MQGVRGGEAVPRRRRVFASFWASFLLLKQTTCSSRSHFCMHAIRARACIRVCVPRSCAKTYFFFLLPSLTCLFFSSCRLQFTSKEVDLAVVSWPHPSRSIVPFSPVSRRTCALSSFLLPLPLLPPSIFFGFYPLLYHFSYSIFHKFRHLQSCFQLPLWNREREKKER